MKTNDGHDFVLGDYLWYVQYDQYEDDDILHSVRYRIPTAGGEWEGGEEWVETAKGNQFYIPHCFSTEAAALAEQTQAAQEHLAATGGRVSIRAY